MGLCPSKAQQPQEVYTTLEKASDRGGQAAAVSSPQRQGQNDACSPLPDQRPGADSGQPAAAAGDGAHSEPGGSQALEGGLQVSAGNTAGPLQQSSSPQPPGTGCNNVQASSAALTGESPGLVNGGTSASHPAASKTQPSNSTAVQQQQKQQQLSPQEQLRDAQQPAKQWDRATNVQAPSALASAGSSRLPSQTCRSVKFACTVPESEDGSACGDDSNQRLTGGSEGGGGATPSRSSSKRSMPRRSVSSSALRPATNEVSEAVLAKQAEILRSNKTGKLRMRRGGLDTSFAALQGALTQDAEPMEQVATRAAALKHIGFGPFKRENQDEFFIQVGDFGGVPGGNLFCVFDGHGTHGKDAALYSRQLLPRLLDVELRKYFMRVGQDSEAALRGAVEVLITEVFGDTERNLAKSGVNLASSGTTASVAFQRGNRLWVAAAGDSRAILCTRNARDQWRALPLTIDHRPRRTSERERVEAAGARVAPKRLPSGRSVGEPRLWLQDAGGPGLLLSRSLGDLTAATVGCTSDPEVTFTTLRPHTDQVLVMATDGVWDVLTNEQVCDIVVESPDPHIACRRVLDAALYEWEERMSADNITVLVVEFEWNEDGLVPAAVDHATATAFRSEIPQVLQAPVLPGPQLAEHQFSGTPYQ